MKNYSFKNYFCKCLTIITVVLLFTSLSSCGKKDDDSAMPKGKTAKFTITVNGVLEEDSFLFVVSGGVAGSTQNAIWKINSATQANETTVSLDKNDFTGTTKTYIIESTVPLDVIVAGIQSITYNHTYTVSYKAEINGEVKNEVNNFTVSKNNDFTKDYTY